MAPVFQDNHNHEPVITSSDAIGRLYSPPILWDWKVSNLETIPDFGNAANLPVPVFNTPVLATPNHVLENEHFLHISPRDISSLATRASYESPTDKAFNIIIIIILVVVFLVFPLLACLGAVCGLVDPQAENQTDNPSNTRVTDPTPLNTSSNTGVMPIPPPPSHQVDSPPCYSNGIRP